MKTLLPLLIISVIVILTLLFIPLKVDYGEGSKSITGFLIQTRIAEYDINASVIEVRDTTKLGISVDYTELNFGYIPLGSKVTKYLNLTTQNPVKIHVDVGGDIKDFITINERDFILKESVNIPVIFEAEELGNFSGRVEITANRPRHSWLSWTIDYI